MPPHEIVVQFHILTCYLCHAVTHTKSHTTTVNYPLFQLLLFRISSIWGAITCPPRPWGATPFLAPPTRPSPPVCSPNITTPLIATRALLWRRTEWTEPWWCDPHPTSAPPPRLPLPLAIPRHTPRPRLPLIRPHRPHTARRPRLALSLPLCRGVSTPPCRRPTPHTLRTVIARLLLLTPVPPPTLLPPLSPR